MNILCSDLEGVLVPEIWIGVAEKTGIDELKLTTRDIADYDELMKKRLTILNANRLTIHDITAVIKTLEPLEGALEFVDWVRTKMQFIIVSDTYTQFAGPLMEKLNYPTIFCNHLTIANNGMITDYHLRQTDGKRQVIKALHSTNSKAFAVGDSYNDISMLMESDKGILFRPPESIIREYPQFPVTYQYQELKSILNDILPVGGSL